MKRSILLSSCLVVAASMIMGSSALAKKKKRRYKAPYGMAGCGFGALVIDRNEMLPQIGAWFLNGLYTNNTYAMTSGTSNCVPPRRLASKEKEVYLRANWTSLSKEAAQGQGEHLDGLADLLGCSTEVWGAFGSFNKNHYGELFASDDMANTLVQYESKLKGNALLSQACVRI